MASPWADPWYKHFILFYESPYFVELLRNTFIISFHKLIFGTVPPIMMALMLNECRSPWFKNLIQTVSYMPHFLSWVIIYGILLAFLSKVREGSMRESGMWEPLQGCMRFRRR